MNIQFKYMLTPTQRASSEPQHSQQRRRLHPNISKELLLSVMEQVFSSLNETNLQIIYTDRSIFLNKGAESRIREESLV